MEGLKRRFLFIFPSMESRLQRYKFGWRVLMVSNLVLGAFIFGKTKKKEGSLKNEKHDKAPVPPGSSAPAVISVEQRKFAPATPNPEIVLSAGSRVPTSSFVEEPQIAPATPIAEIVHPSDTSASTVSSMVDPEISSTTSIAEAVLPTGTSEPTVSSMKESKIASANPFAETVYPACRASEIAPVTPDFNFVDESEVAPVTPIADLVKVHEPIAEDQQQELFKWILDEKRKVKPSNKDEKKQIDEEKAILKQFIRAKSNPSL